MYVGSIRLSPPASARLYGNPDNLIFGLSESMKTYDPFKARFGDDGKVWEKRSDTWHKIQDLAVVPMVDDQGGAAMGGLFAPDLSVDSFCFIAKDFDTLWRGFRSLKPQYSTLKMSKPGNIAFFTRKYKSATNKAKWLFVNPLEKMRKRQSGLRSGLYSQGVYMVVGAAAHIGDVKGATSVHQSVVSLGSLQALAQGKGAFLEGDRWEMNGTRDYADI